MKLFFYYIATILLFLLPWKGEAKNKNHHSGKSNPVISGHIKDASTGEDLIGATIYIEELKTGAITNVYGYYSISVKQGTYTLVYSFTGYQSITKNIELTENQTINIELSLDTRELNEVVVTSERPDENISSTQMSVQKIQARQIKSVPALMGEVDPIKVLQLLPGVQATSEGSSGFSVRGGSPDQNLILLDEATVYNAGHLMGFFSVFNNDAIKGIQLYKGDIPARYGGRLASLLDVRMKDGNSKSFSGSGGIGTVSSRLTLEGPIGSEKTTYLFSGRRTYLDLILPFAGEDLKDNTLYFYDFNGKINHRINENNRIYLSGYGGRDYFGNDFAKFDFGNKTFTLRWNHIFNPKLFSNQTFVYSNYTYGLSYTDSGNDSFEWNSNLEDIAFKSDYNYYLNRNNKISFGLQIQKHYINPGYAKGIGENALFNEITVPLNIAMEGGLYLSNEQTINSRLSLKYGLRFSSFWNMGETTVYEYDENYEPDEGTKYDAWEVYNSYYNLEPRIAFNYKLTSSTSIKGSYSRSVQYLQLASNSTSGSPLDVWFPASNNIKPQLADQLSIGYFRNFKQNTIETSVELFYKNMQNTIDFTDHADLLLNEYLEGEVRTGSSYAYGAEFLVKVNREKFNGWISYTYSRSFRKIPEILDEEYPSTYDRPHDISIVFNHKVGKRGQISANWVYSMGQAFTAPVARYQYGNDIVPVYSSRNDMRMPDYHRLDIGYTLQCKNKKNRKWQGEWNFSVYNAYARKNAWMLNFEQDEDDPYTTKAVVTSLFSLIPSISYNFKF